MPKVLDSLSLGVMEYWSAEKRDITPLAINPTLQYSNTLVEAWVNLDALHAHLKTPHMAAYREAAKNYVQDIRLQVLQLV